MLNHIADTVPGKAKYRKGWNARLDKLGAKLGIEDAPFAPPELRPEFEALPDTRGEGVFYHGARGEVPDLSEGYYNPANIYGGQDTFYSTDALDIAGGYRRKNPGGRIYRADEHSPVNFFDMEAPLATHELESIFAVRPDDDGLVPMSIDEAVQNGGGQANLRQVMDEIRASSGGEGVSRDEVQELFDTAITNLRHQGYGGMAHVGGLRTKKPAHQVKIYFDAPNQLKLTDVTGEVDARALAAREASLPPAIEVKSKGVPRRSGPRDLMQEIADAGGLRDNEGHDLVKGRGVPKFALGAGTIVRKGGRSIDAMGEHLWEQGWFGPPSTTPRPDEDAVLGLLDQATHGKVYRPEDAAAIAERTAARDAMPEEDARFELQAHAADHGVHLDPATLDAALMHRSGGETVEDAVARAVHEAAYGDAAGADGLARLDDEEAAGWKAQIDSIEHDLRMDAEGDPRIAELLESFDREAQGAAALRACMAPKVEISG
jgi:hypothetical protein